MTEAQEFARKRSWTKMRLVGMQTQIRGLANSGQLCKVEEKKLNHIADQMDEVTSDWNDNYKQAKYESL
jgi:hypothetical protein